MLVVPIAESSFNLQFFPKIKTPYKLFSISKVNIIIIIFKLNTNLQGTLTYTMSNMSKHMHGSLTKQIFSKASVNTPHITI